MLDHDLEGFVLGHVVLDARETRLLPVQRYLPPRMPVENGALARREERLSDRPWLLGHAAHAGLGDRPAQRLIGRMGTQRRCGAMRHAIGATLAAVNGHGSSPNGCQPRAPRVRPTRAGGERSRRRDWRCGGHPQT